jgi:putative NADH-flavin reductase
VKIALMGASGFVGSRILQEALNRGHVVTAISRTPEKLPPHPNLHSKKAEVSDVAALTEHFRGQDAVIHSYAPPPDPEVRAFVFAALEAGDQREETVRSYVPRDMAAHDAHVKGRIEAQTSGTRSIIEAAKAAGVKRILAVGGAGTLLVNGVRSMDHPDFPKAFEGGAKSTAVVKELLRGERDIEWTVLCPPLSVAPGERTGEFRLGLDHLLIAADGSSKISLEDYAMAMIDELEQPRHTGRRFTAGY